MELSEIKIKNRAVRFLYSNPEWDVSMSLIRGNKNNYIIDTGLGSLCAEPMKKAIKGDEKMTVVINTHHHWDHVWGNGAFRDGMIAAHTLCRELIANKWDEMLQKNGKYRTGQAERSLPGVVFDKELYFAEDQIRLFHSPGHTPDSISVLDEAEGVLYLGDNVGDTPEEPVPSLYCEKAVYINTLQEYQRLDYDVCVSGHNVVLKKDILNKILSMME